MQNETTTRTAIPISARDKMLLDFLREYDADCPFCGYNVRAITRPVCPECGNELSLTVGAKRLRLAWLLATVAPCFFSGIAAIFVLIPIVGRYIFGDGVLEPMLIAVDLFGFCSGAFAITLVFRWRNRFLAQTRAQQILFAIVIWLIHVAALAMFIFLAVAII